MTQHRMTPKERDAAIVGKVTMVLMRLQKEGIVILGGSSKDVRLSDKDVVPLLYTAVNNDKKARYIILPDVNIIDFPNGAKAECRKVIMILKPELLLRENGTSLSILRQTLRARFSSRHLKPLENGLLGEHLALIEPQDENEEGYLWVCRAPVAVFVKKGNMAIEMRVPVTYLHPNMPKDDTVILYVNKEGLPVG